MSNLPQPTPTTFETVREIALTLPHTAESTSYGTPSFKVKGNFLCRLKEDGDTLVLKIDEYEKEALIALDPHIFYTTDHYNGYPAVLIRLSQISRAQLEHLMERAWRFVAPKRVIAEADKQAKD